MPESAVGISKVDGRALVVLKTWSGAVDLPTTLVASDLGGAVNIIRLAPGEWLSTSDVLSGRELCERLAITSGGTIATTDLSSGIKVVRVEGTESGALLEKACGLDLRPRIFPAGHSTRTRFAQLPVIVSCVAPSSRFDLYVGRSYLAWVISWLVDATTYV
jgi:sarcosine oxidase subunit gamma